MVTSEELYLVKGSSKVVFMRPAGGERIANTHDLEMATEYVGILVANVVTALQSSERLAFYRRMNTVKWLNDAGGKVFERLVHEYYERTGTFSLGQPLEANDPLPAGTTFKIGQSEEFESLKDLKPTLHTYNSPNMLTGRTNTYFKVQTPGPKSRCSR
jgi:hypothetical protein